MAKRKRTPTQVINKLRAIKLSLARCGKATWNRRKAAINVQAHRCWRPGPGGMNVSEANKRRRLQHENACLKNVVAKQALDILVLKEAAQ